MKIETKLAAAASEALRSLYGLEVKAEDIQLQKTKREFEGHITIVVFPYLRASRKGPEQTATEIGQWLVDNVPFVSAMNAVKGFLNISISKEAWIELLEEIDSDEKYGIKTPNEKSPLVMVEYSSPNTNKPLHLGHVRNNLLGWALAQLLQADGNKVVKTNIVNDRGIHICKSMLAWQKFGNGETPQSSGKKGDHLIGDYYVCFDKHYRAEVAALADRFRQEGMDEEKARERAEQGLH